MWASATKAYVAFPYHVYVDVIVILPVGGLPIIIQIQIQMSFLVNYIGLTVFSQRQGGGEGRRKGFLPKFY